MPPTLTPPSCRSTACRVCSVTSNLTGRPVFFAVPSRDRPHTPLGATSSTRSATVRRHRSPQLAVDCEIEHRQVARPTVHLQAGTDRPACPCPGLSSRRRGHRLRLNLHGHLPGLVRRDRDAGPACPNEQPTSAFDAVPSCGCQKSARRTRLTQSRHSNLASIPVVLKSSPGAPAADDYGDRRTAAVISASGKVRFCVRIRKAAPLFGRFLILLRRHWYSTLAGGSARLPTLFRGQHDTERLAMLLLLV